MTDQFNAAMNRTHWRTNNSSEILENRISIDLNNTKTNYTIDLNRDPLMGTLINDTKPMNVNGNRRIFAEIIDKSIIKTTDDKLLPVPRLSEASLLDFRNSETIRIQSNHTNHNSNINTNGTINKDENQLLIATTTNELVTQRLNEIADELNDIDTIIITNSTIEEQLEIEQTVRNEVIKRLRLLGQVLSNEVSLVQYDLYVNDQNPTMRESI